MGSLELGADHSNMKAKKMHVYVARVPAVQLSPALSSLSTW